MVLSSGGGKGRDGNGGLSKVKVHFFSQSHTLQVKAQNCKWTDSATLSDNEQRFIA